MGMVTWEGCSGSGVRVMLYMEESQAPIANWERLPVVGLKWEAQFGGVGPVGFLHQAKMS